MYLKRKTNITISKYFLRYFVEQYFEEMLMLKLITTIRNKKYLILTFPPNLDTKSVSKSFFLINFLQS